MPVHQRTTDPTPVREARLTRCSRRTDSFTPVVLKASCVLATIGAPALAGIIPITTEWVGPASGVWAARENWSAGTPDAADTALFSLDPDETVTVASETATGVGRLLIRSGTVSLATEGLFEATSATAVLPSILIGDSPAFAAFEFSGAGGGHFMEIASHPLGSAGSTLAEGSSLNLAGALTVGFSGTGTLTSINSDLACLRLILGGVASGTGVAEVAGGSVTLEQSLVAGQLGAGVLELSGGANLIAGNGAIGLNPFSSGSVVISGEETSAVFLETLDVGVRGIGTLDIVDGATVSVVQDAIVGVFSGSFTFPFFPWGEGTLSVLSGGTLALGADLYMPLVGIGTLIVGEGGRITVDGDIDVTAPSRARFEFRIDGEDDGGAPLIAAAGSLVQPPSSTAFAELEVILADGHRPIVGDTVALIEASEILVNFEAALPPAPAGVIFQLTASVDAGRETLRFNVIADPDLDGDGVVNAEDLGLLLAAWGSTGPADLNGDGLVDAADLGLLLAAFE